MTFSLIVDRPWRYRHPKRGMQTLQPGRYRVPEEIPEAIARRAVSDGMAKREATFGEKFAKAFKPAPRTATPVAATMPTRKPSGQRGRKKKAAAASGLPMRAPADASSQSG